MARMLLGVDIGGTNMKIASFDAETYEIVRSEIVPTEAEKGFPDVLSRVIALVENYRTPDVSSVGICVPGPVRQPEGLLLRAPNIPKSENIRVLDLAQSALKMPVFLGNDAQCFALAEAVLGAGKNHKVVCGVTIGTGVGGGLVIDGNIYQGAHGFAAEVGHMLLRPGEPPFETRDKRGEVEQFFSGSAFAERCKAAASPDDYLHGEACSFLHPDIFREIAWMCTNLSHAYDPSIIVFGGTTGKALKPHLEAIAKELKTWMLPSVPIPLLAIAKRQHPGTLGAALLSR